MNAVIAIDGPSGAGKGTVARAVARTLAWKHVDTGAMYRAVAWKTREEGYRFDDEEAVTLIASRSVFEVNDLKVIIDGYDVTTAIRTSEIDVAAATVARLPRVREVLVARQRNYAALGPVVMEGRDIGTVVFPKASVKIYLDASPKERAKRRLKDPAHGLSSAGTVGFVAKALQTRDALDRTRQASPLVRAIDATFIDTTGLSIDDVVSRVMQVIREKITIPRGDDLV